MLKHTIYLIIIAICCCFTNSINAQSAPGLLGKRITLSYDYNTHVNYTLPNIFIDEYDFPLFYNTLVVQKHVFGADYALSRTMSIGLDYGFHSQRLDDETIQNNEFRHRVKSNEFGVRLKIFPFEKGGIAPIGYYFQVRGLRYAYRSEMELALNENQPTNLTEPFTFEYEAGTTYTGSLGFGRQGILFQNILYNIGCEMALVVTENGFSDTLADPSRNVRNSLLATNLFKLKIGIAVPIF